MITPPKDKVILVDFDGTVVDHDFPRVGEDVPGAVTVLRHLAKDNHLILWTMRSNGCLRNPSVLRDAIRWYKDRDIPLYGVNQNPDQGSWTNSPKAYGHLCIDDTAVGCPLLELPGMDRPVVDWDSVSDMLGLYPEIGDLIPERIHRNSRWLRESVRLASKGLVELRLADGFDNFDVLSLESVGVDGKTRRVSFIIGSKSISSTQYVVGCEASSGAIRGIKTLGDVETILNWMKGWTANE